jgi:hypothetical protein
MMKRAFLKTVILTTILIPLAVDRSHATCYIPHASGADPLDDGNDQLIIGINSTALTASLLARGLDGGATIPPAAGGLRNVFLLLPCDRFASGEKLRLTQSWEKSI